MGLNVDMEDDASGEINCHQDSPISQEELDTQFKLWSYKQNQVEKNQIPMNDEDEDVFYECSSQEGDEFFDVDEFTNIPFDVKKNHNKPFHLKINHT